ncbi:MAG: hypothetical protein ABI488_00085 [Polyangiaceae bacterium]
MLEAKGVSSLRAFPAMLELNLNFIAKTHFVVFPAQRQETLTRIKL